MTTSLIKFWFSMTWQNIFYLKMHWFYKISQSLGSGARLLTTGSAGGSAEWTYWPSPSYQCLIELKPGEFSDQSNKVKSSCATYTVSHGPAQRCHCHYGKIVAMKKCCMWSSLVLRWIVYDTVHSMWMLEPSVSQQSIPTLSDCQQRFVFPGCIQGKLLTQIDQSHIPSP